MRRFILYLLRWQLSTPILWLVLRRMGTGIWSTVVANLIGGAIFFWVDKFIFTSKAVEVWHVKEGKCDKCGAVSHLWRLIKTAGYDKSGSQPVFLSKLIKKHFPQVQELSLTNNYRFNPNILAATTSSIAAITSTPTTSISN